jgi:hypothetical protein
VGFSDAVAHADAFWGAVAGVDAALIIAVVVEGRTVREDLERIEAERSREHLERWEAVQQALDAHKDPPEPPSLVRQIGTPDQRERTGRIVIALAATISLGLSLVVALTFLSPIHSLGDPLPTVGFIFAATCSVLGLVLLIVMGARRMTGRTVKQILQGR